MFQGRFDSLLVSEAWRRIKGRGLAICLTLASVPLRSPASWEPVTPQCTQSESGMTTPLALPGPQAVAQSTTSATKPSSRCWQLKSVRIPPSTCGPSSKRLGLTPRLSEGPSTRTLASKATWGGRDSSWRWWPGLCKKVKRCMTINNFLNGHGSTIWLFSDKKAWTVDQARNAQNDWWLAFDPSDVPPIANTKHPASVMMLGVVSSEGKAMHLIWFPKGLRLRARDYLEVMQEEVWPWATKNFAGKFVVWQQDSAPPTRPRLSSTGATSILTTSGQWPWGHRTCLTLTRSTTAFGGLPQPSPQCGQPEGLRRGGVGCHAGRVHQEDLWPSSAQGSRPWLLPRAGASKNKCTVVSPNKHGRVTCFQWPSPYWSWRSPKKTQVFIF